MPWGIVARAAGLTAIGFVAGLTVNGWRYGAEIADLRAEHAIETQALAQAASKATTQARREEQAAAASIASIDRRYQEDISNAQTELERLRDAVAAGERRLRVNATCSAGTGVPGTAPAAGVGDAAAPRLEDAARRDYFRLLDRVTLMQSQLEACQAYVKVVAP